MADWPQQGNYPGDLSGMTAFSNLSIGVSGLLGIPASAAWPANNTAYFIPFRLSRPHTVSKLGWANGTSASGGNIDAGIYAKDGTRLASTGSTVQGAASSVQIVTLGTALHLGRGVFYLALAASSTACTVMRSTGPATITVLQALGMAQMASAFVLPASATLASLGTIHVPQVFAQMRSAP